MSTSENSNGNKTFNVHLSKQKIKDLNKDFIINKLQKELTTLSKELIKLRTENAELRSRVSLTLFFSKLLFLMNINLI